MDPFPGVDSVFGEEKWCGATSTPVWNVEEFATSNFIKGKCWSLPASSGHPLFVPKEMRHPSGTRMNRPLEGLVCMNFRSEENLDLPGNCNVVASDFYVTFV